ncbi:hypothetical protein AFV9_gp30 [Betalipothrixvirus uzonense]|uniref:Uncharacterized protein n=1 Tax=Betalipothrixvirus uzonense TaxID=512792 RepID=B2CRK7_9VIRU|nr:hypothetical protein AFV9_gp30 [Acidianus filamentous virus 9]ACB37264.1 hypothetical protein [Acidianus filamentous virus 9]
MSEKTQEEIISELSKKVEELQKKLDETNSQLDKVRQAVKTIAGILDNHLKGKWTLEDIQVALNHINEMVQLLTQAGIIRPGGEGGGNWLQMMLAQQFMQQKQAQNTDVEIEPIKKKNKKKLKKLLGYEEEE